MAIRENLYFSYNGIRSVDMGIINVNIGGGMMEEQFVPSRSINETKIRGRRKPYFQSLEYDPLEFEVSFAFTENYSEEKIREVARWLVQDYYKPFIFSENNERVFYCMYEGDSQLVHNGLKQGYLTMTFRCDSPYTYSPVQVTNPPYDYSTNVVDGTLLKFENHGDVDLQPEIWIKKVGLGDVRIVNENYGNAEFKFTGLADGETVYVDNENEYIDTDLPDTYRYNDFNNGYLNIARGVNNLRVYGNCTLQFRYQFKTLQG